MKELYITLYVDSAIDTPEQMNEISYVLNECCSKLESLKCQVHYRMRDTDGKEIKLEIP